jgi:hypothetical protein
MSGTGYVPLPAPVTADPGFWQKGMEGLNALRDTQAKQAIAGIYQQSTDPVTGQVDPGKFNLLISRNPQAAWAAGPAMQQQGQAAAAQGQGAQETLAAHRARMDSMLGQMNGLLTKGGPIQIGDIQSALNQAHLSPAEAQTITQDVNSTSGGDPGYDFTNWVRNHQAANLNAQGQIALRTPNMQFQSTPQGLVAVDMNPNTTRTPAGTAIPFGLGPNDQYWDPNTNSFVKAGGIVPPGTVTPPGGGGGGGTGGAAGRVDPASMVNSIANTLGTSPANAAAIASNFHAESLLAPGINEIRPAPGTRGGYGLAQWTDTQGSPRRSDLEAFAKGNNLDVSQPATQLAFMKQEIATKYPDLLKQMDAAQTPEQKAAIFYSAYEGGPPRLVGAHVAHASQFAALAPPGQQGGGTAAATPPAPVPVPGGQGLVRYADGSVGTPGGGFGRGVQTAGPGAPTTTAPAPTAPATAPQPATPTTTPTAPPAARTGPLMAGPPMGLETTIEGRAKASVDMASAMHAQASQSPQRQAILADMDATNKQINTGPATESALKWSAFANQLPGNIGTIIPGMSREQVAGTEGFAKLAETFRQMQAGGIAGTLTNDKFASALASNPHLALSTLGNQGMIHLLQGNEDALQTKDRAWQAASGANPGLDYQTWETNFNKTFDPRVFWWSRMTRPEAQRLMSGMDEPAQKTLLGHLKQAEADGLITRPGPPGG